MFVTLAFVLRAGITGYRRLGALRRRQARHGKPAVCNWYFERLEERTLLSAYTNFTLIWDANGHSAFAPSLNDATTADAATAAFAWHPSVRDSDIATGNGGPLRTVFNCLFCNLGRQTPAINQRGSVAFFAEGFKVNGISRDDSPIAVADPDSLFRDFGPKSEPAPSLNDAGTVAFFANLNPQGSGLFRGDGTTTTAIATSGNFFRDFSAAPAINNQEMVAFWAQLALTGGQSGLFREKGGTFTDIALTGGIFSSLDLAPSLNNAGAVAFYATLTTGRSGIFLWDGNTTTQIATTTAGFRGFSPAPSLNNNGNVAFLAQLDGGGSAIFTTAAGRVIATGDPLLGSTVTDLSFFRQGLNDADSVAFAAHLANGHSVVVRADTNSASQSDAPRLTAVFAASPPGSEGQFRNSFASAQGNSTRSPAPDSAQLSIRLSPASTAEIQAGAPDALPHANPVAVEFSCLELPNAGVLTVQEIADL